MNASRSRRRHEADPIIVDQVRSAASTHLGVDLRDVQVTAGTQLLQGRIAEMQTGEGKTLSTVIPASVLASSGRKVLIATANDYLAARDADWMGPLYREFGLRVSHITSTSTSEQRREAYEGDISYGTLREFAFDFLRHSLESRQQSAQVASPRFPLDVLVIDEADSVLIDEARTPMIITASTEAMDEPIKACYHWSAKQACDYLRQTDYVRLAESGAIALTDCGRRRAIHAEMPEAMRSLTTTDILHCLERAIWINEAIHRDQHYVVKGRKIHLVDEYTGRKSGERHFGGGIHQAIEAREGLDLSPESQPVARVSVQDFVGKFDHLCGITATAWEDRRELRNVYGLRVHRVATHQPSQRKILQPAVCRSREQKWDQIVEETQAVIAKQRAVLVGTRTVAQSEQLSERFQTRGIDHVVLNARNHRQEAAIIAGAGRVGRVTIATNMAGRGTDIQLEPAVTAAGGLHVIVSEPHAAARIDRQLIGRCARQGDPGSARIFASPDDEILAQAFGRERAEQIRQSALGGASESWLLAKLKRAQQRVSQNHRRERARLTAHEDTLAESMQRLGLDPHLDPLPEIR